MEVKRYDQFINEAKKDDAKEEIIKMLEDKPTVPMSSDAWPTEKGIYTQAGMIRYLKGKFTNHQVIGGLHDLKNDKKSGLKHIMVKNYKYNENYPYYYIGLTEDEAKDIKAKYEEKNEVSNKKDVDKRKEAKVSAAKKAEEEKKPAKKVAKKAAPKKVGTKKVAAKKATKSK